VPVRGLAAFLVVALALGVSVAACGSPVISSQSQTPQPLVDAQATNVRRTAVAEVQRIIANNPSPTATPNATPIPRPTCQNAIWWHEARSHLGEVRTVQGTIVATRPAPDGLAVLELGQPYPDPIGVAVMIPAAAAPALGGKTVCVTGRINAAEGRPTILARDPSSIVVVS
jgi:hypothetical protein